jgi:hypothetical protein
VATLDDLLIPRDRDTTEALLLSTLQGESFPVTDWYTGSVPKTLLKMFATGLLDRETLLRYVVSGGFLDLAVALTDPDGNPVEVWAENLAQQNYGLTRAAATFTQKYVTLSCASGFGPYSRGAGELRAVSQSGNYYVNTDALSLADGSSATITFQCESPGLVIDATGTIDKLVTPLPGVSIVDAQTQFSVPIRFWSGTGNITPSATGTPSPSRTIKVTIMSAGRIGDATAKLDIYTGSTVTSVATFTIGATQAQGDITLTFTDGPSGTNSFIGADTWFVSTPGEPTIQNGSDKEPLSVLAQRCRDRWPSLSAIPTEGKYAGWARQCSFESALGVNRVATSPSTTVAGVVNVWIADASGAATPATVTAVQNYIDLRSVDIERANVTTAAAVTISVTGKVWVKRSRLVAVKAAVKLLWNQYLAVVPIGGEQPGGLVRCSKLDQILEDAGVFNSENLQINSIGSDIDLELDPDEVPAASANGTDDLSWYEVA